MSRALNIDATMDEVIALSAKHDAAISAIESLHPAGTRVVFVNAEGAASVTKAFGARILTGTVNRTPWTQQRVS